jgi:hypothetical protein
MMSSGSGDGPAGSAGEVTVHILDDVHYVGPVTDIPDPPPNLPYADYDDWFWRELLVANSIEPDATGIAAGLGSQEALLLSAAAHSAYPFPSLIPLLRQVAEGDDDDAAVEAAYALARQGDGAAVDMLREALVRPLGPYLSPVRAAGMLARLGDLSGEPVVRAGLRSELLAVRMLSCKQLYHFAPGVGRGGGLTGGDWAGLVSTALADDEPTVQREILLQLRSIPRSPAVLDLLRTYLDSVEEPSLAARAREIVETHAGS